MRHLSWLTLISVMSACAKGVTTVEADGNPCDEGFSRGEDGNCYESTEGTEPEAKPEEDGLIWPDAEWQEGSPADHGLDADKLEAFRAYTFLDGHNTQSVVVIKDGVLVAEWYADGTDKDTPVTTWSAGKSVTSALFGVGLREGLLELDDPVGDYVSEWAEGENSAITIRHLLEMRSGLPSNFSNPYGVYAEEPDQLRYSLDRTPIRAPGQVFEYVNEDTMVLGHVLTQVFGESVIDIAEDEIFGPIGLDGTWWTDGRDNTLAYCCIDTTARSFSRFGLLYARGGKWKDTQIVPNDFVTASTRGISYYGYYGMQWWTYGDLYAAVGYHGQLVYVYPEQDMVVARFGTYTHEGDGFDRVGYNYHDTLDSGTFDQSIFATLFLDAIIDD
jgi:CubicO group peptidase (beta-lactamase class C family)